MGDRGQGHSGFIVRVLMVSSLASLLGATAEPAPDARAVVRGAVRVLASERAGFVALHQHYAYEEYGPAHHKTLVEDFGRLYKDGTLIAVRIYSKNSNGSVASADDLAKQQSELDKKLPEEDYQLPLTDAALADYRFDLSLCSECAPGSVAVTFVSLKRDPDHGDGTVVVDEASHHVLSLNFRPSALPKDADSGSIAMTFGQVLPGLWDLVKTESRYTGHVLFMHGGANITQTDGSYRRFGSLDEAKRALAAGI